MHVTRADVPGGWGQRLSLECVRAAERRAVLTFGALDGFRGQSGLVFLVWWWAWWVADVFLMGAAFGVELFGSGQARFFFLGGSYRE